MTPTGRHRNSMAAITEGQLIDLVQRADDYILAMRQVIYSNRPGVKDRAMQKLNELGSCWYAARESCASDVPEGSGPKREIATS